MPRFDLRPHLMRSPISSRSRLRWEKRHPEENGEWWRGGPKMFLEPFRTQTSCEISGHIMSYHVISCHIYSTGDLFHPTSQLQDQFICGPFGTKCGGLKLPKASTRRGNVSGQLGCGRDFPAALVCYAYAAYAHGRHHDRHLNFISSMTTHHDPEVKSQGV